MRPFAALFVFAAACGASPPPEASRPLESGPSEPPATEATEDAAPAAPPVTEPAPPPTEAAPTATQHAAIPCDADGDCGWDDPCVPTHCVEHREPASDCSGASPAPGACACLGGYCTLVPTGTSASSGGVVPGPPCRSFCSADPSGGTCLPDDPSGLMRDGVIRAGAECRCEPQGAPDATCRFEIVPSIACTDARDCDAVDGPSGPRPQRAHPRRRRDFVPCRDGEWAPVCNQGFCSVVGFGC